MSQTIDSSARRQEKLGRKLAAAKKVCRESRRPWKSYVKERFGLSRERADELIRIGMGFLSVEASRTASKKRQRKTRLVRRMMSSNAMIAQHVDRSKVMRDKIAEGLTLRKFSRKELAEIKTASQEANAVWQDLLQILEKETVNAQ